MSGPIESQAAQVLLQVEPDWDAARVERSLQGLQRRARRRSLLRGALLGTVLASAAAVLVIVQLNVLGEEQAPVAGAAPLVDRGPAADPARVMLADGSTIQRVAQAEVIVHEVSETKVRVELQRGHVALDVTPRPEREFVVDAGAYLALVLGTTFDVDRGSDGVLVRVERGHVRVLRADGSPVRDLYAGQSGRFSNEAASEAPSEPPATEFAPPETAVRAAPAKAADWRPLARTGGYAEAYALIQRGDAVHDTLDDLLLAADAARLSGHQAEALPYLEQAVKSHASDARAPMAAFTLGRVLLSLGRAAGAGAAFERALALGASGSLEENALARAVEAYGRTGDARAKTLARSYVSQYPQGRWLSVVRQHAGPDGE